MDKIEVEIGPTTLPSIDDMKPVEEGGPFARAGFTYQDEVGVNFLIEMLMSDELIKVHCETHDDLILVSKPASGQNNTAEFVQVKGNELDHLWSVATLCARQDTKPGTSIFEKSLSRDRCCEESRFRIVTSRSVNSDLKFLTYRYDPLGRQSSEEKFQALASKLNDKFPIFKSGKGNGPDFWIKFCYWDVRHSLDSVRNSNVVDLNALIAEEGMTMLPEQVDALLDEMRLKVKTASETRWEQDKDNKIIKRNEFREWFDRRVSEIQEGISGISGDKLRNKMEAARIPDDLIKNAISLRRYYAKVIRTSRYMEPRGYEKLQYQVQSKIQSLRSGYAASELGMTGVAFHDECLRVLRKVNASRNEEMEDQTAFLQGFMYDIADRCLLKFERP